MPDSGGRVSNTWITCLQARDNTSKGVLIPDELSRAHAWVSKAHSAWRGVRGPSASWRGNGPPRRRRVAGLRGWSATLGLRHGPDSYGRQQWGIFRNGRKPDGATPRERRRPSGRKALSRGTIMTVPLEEAPANYVPAAAVKRRGRALSGITGRKGRVGGYLSQV